MEMPPDTVGIVLEVDLFLTSIGENVGKVEFNSKVVVEFHR